MDVKPDEKRDRREENETGTLRQATGAPDMQKRKEEAARAQMMGGIEGQAHRRADDQLRSTHRRFR